MITFKKSTVNFLVLALIAFIYPPIGIIFVLATVLFSNWDQRLYITPHYAIFFALIFAVLGYNMTTQSTDLQAYIKVVNDVSGLSLNDIFNTLFFNSKTQLYITDLFIYLASRSGNPYILPCIVGFVNYYIIFYIFFDFRNRSKNYNKIQLLLLSILLIGVITPVSVISNTRCVTSYVIICFAAYREFVQHKRNAITLILYIITIWIHTSAIAFLMIRILIYMVKYIGKLSIFLALFATNIIDFLHNTLFNISIGNNLFQLIYNAINQAYFYLHEIDPSMNAQYRADINNIFVRIYGTCFILGLLFIIYYQSYVNKKNPLKYEKIVEYIIMICIFSLGTLSIPTGIFWRYEAAIIFLSPIILMRTVNSNDTLVKSISYLLMISGAIVGLIMFTIQIMWIPPKSLVYGFVTTNGLKIGYELLKAVF